MSLFSTISYVLKSVIGPIDTNFCFVTIRTLAETKIGRLVYANGQSGGTVVTITLLFTFIMILIARLPTHLEQTKSVCAIIYLHVKNCIMLETVREANKIINNFRGEREVYDVDLFIFL
jgi:hypothetical protein